MERSCICEAALNHTGAVSFHILFVWGICLCTASHLRDDDGEVSSVSLNWMDKDEDDKDTLLRLTRMRDDDNASAPSSKKQKTFP